MSSISNSIACLTFCGAYTDGCHTLASSATHGHRKTQHQGAVEAQSSPACAVTWRTYPCGWRLDGRKKKHFVFTVQNMTVLSAWGSKDCLQGVDKPPYHEFQKFFIHSTIFALNQLFKWWSLDNTFCCFPVCLHPANFTYNTNVINSSVVSLWQGKDKPVQTLFLSLEIGRGPRQHLYQ